MSGAGAFAAAVLAGLALWVPIEARGQGFATWLGDRVGAGDVGRALDRANDAVKNTVPGYGQAESLITAPVRHLTTEAVVEAAGPLLKNAILMSRDDALGAGATGLPVQIRYEFQGFYSADVLSARWRVGQGNDLSLQANSFRFGDRAGIALDNVVVFRSPVDANSLWLWAHELAHIEQYRKWGVDNFAKSYVRSSDEIEDAANKRADEFMAWRQQRFLPGSVSQASSQPGATSATNASTLCRFSGGPRSGEVQDYAPMQAIPVGSSCQDGVQSYGVVVSADNSSPSGTAYQSGSSQVSNVSTFCRFTSGPRAGQVQDYAPMQAIPIGSSCQDGEQSFGVVIAPGGPAGGPSQHPGVSTLCRFTAGARSGQVQDYAPMQGIAVGSSCQDGTGSSGIVIAPPQGDGT